MKNLLKVVPALILSVGLAFSSQSQAQTVSATATTTIDVNFPEILILYTYSDITLDLDETFLTNETDIATGSTACGDGYCSDQGSATAITVDAASKDVDIEADITAISDTSVEFTLTNAFAARSLGMTDTDYEVDITEANNSTVVNLGTGVPSTLSNSGLTPSAGDIPLAIDLNSLNNSDTESEDIEITISGT